MAISNDRNTRRHFLKTGIAAAAIGATGHSYGDDRLEKSFSFNPELTSKDINEVARDESYWQYVGKFYDRTEGIINLEHGYWGKMAKPIEEHYQELTHRVNQQLSYYARKHWHDDVEAINKKMAAALEVKSTEITLTRNATESLHSIIGQYRNFKPGDALLWADIDYPAFKRSMQWLAESKGLQPVILEIPTQATESQLVELYQQAFKEHPNIRMALVTHVSNQHGLKLPVKAIAELARKADIDLICDCAQSWGLVDFTMPELGVDWALFNLHKWIGSPVGVGALYMKEGTLSKVGPFPGESDPDNTLLASRVHMATSNFASFLAVPAALDFHFLVGGKYKEARLTYLRQLWVDSVSDNAKIEILGATDAASATGMGGFRIAGQFREEEADQLQKKLEAEYGIFTVVRTGLSSGANLRVTPQVFTRADDVKRLAQAINELS